MIGHFHKNNKHNLISLCEGCHHKVHYGNLEIRGWKNTNKGLILDYSNKYMNSKCGKKFLSNIEEIMAVKIIKILLIKKQ